MFSSEIHGISAAATLNVTFVFYYLMDNQTNAGATFDQFQLMRTMFSPFHVYMCGYFSQVG